MKAGCSQQLLKVDQSPDFYDMNSMTCTSDLFDPSVESDFMGRNLQHNVGWKNLSSENQIVRLTSGVKEEEENFYYYNLKVATLPAGLRLSWLGSTRSSCTRSTVPAYSSSPSAGSPSSSTPRLGQSREEGRGYYKYANHGGIQWGEII